jgi:membrane peptidoglycan carboxypeptidase
MPSPNRYNPHVAPTLATKRAIRLLDRMVEQRRHTAKDAMKAKAQKLAFTAPATKLPGYYGRGPQVGRFAQWAREQSKQKHGPAHRNARAGPWRAHLDPRRRFQAHPGGGRSAARPRGLTLRSPEKPRATPSS